MTLPEIGHKIIHDDGRSKLVEKRVPVKALTGNDVNLRCNGCGDTNWTIHITPFPDLGYGKIHQLVCSRCTKTYVLDDQGRIGGKITINKVNGREREAINGRPDSVG